MGIFDFLTGGEEGQLKRHVKRVSNLNAQAEDREMSAHWLAENGSDAAIVGLLKRFAVTYEQRMKDAREKEMVYGLLLDMGPGVVDAIAAWVRKNDNFALPVNVIENFNGEGYAIGLLLEMIADENDPFKTEKKRQMVVKLAEYQDARIVGGVEDLLTDFDEGVRYAAVETLLGQDGHDDEVRAALLAALAEPSEESNRLRVRIANAFHKRHWTLGDRADDIAKRPPHGWQIQGNRILPG